MIVVPGGSRPYEDDDPVDYSATLVWTVDDVLTAEECAGLIAKIDALGPTSAPITTAAGFVMRPDIRNNTRVVFDDVALAARLFERVRGTLPEVLSNREPVGANERFRCYRYEPGQRFAAHYDGAFDRSKTEGSLLTFMVYLNEGFGGGSTAFLHYGREVVPRTGTALLFQHRLLHEGCAVTSGVKYVLRSDVMYRAR